MLLIGGNSGSGKTVVAVHRARHLARAAHAQGKKVLFLTYGNRLPGVIEYLLGHKIAREALQGLNYDVPAPSWAQPSARAVSKACSRRRVAAMSCT